ncbi:MAG: chromosomal replication initiator protein DnaA [Phycisphaerales bacterium]
MAASLRAASKASGSSFDDDHQLWSAMLAHLRAVNTDICRKWFEELEPLGIMGGVLRLRAHSAIHRDYLHSTCSAPFSEAARAVSGRLVSVRFFGPDDDVKPIAGVKKAAAEAVAAPAVAPATSGVMALGPAELTAEGMAAAAAEVRPSPMPARAPTPDQLAHLYDDGLVLNPDYGFEHFVVGPGNRLAHSAALAVAQNPGRAYNPYFVHGDVGLGKTHILQAICLKIRQTQPAAVIYYTSCEGFMTQFMEAVQAGAMSLFRHKFRHVDVLVIDDIHFLAKRDRTQEEFFHTFNSLYQSHKQIVLSSDAPPEEIPDLEERLVSRFKWGLVCNITPPCYETRVEILKNKAAMRGLTLPDDVACFVAARIDSNIRELEGAITQLSARSLTESKPIDMDLARAALGGDLIEKAEPKIQIQTIINAVTDFYGVKMTDLQSKRRQRSIALPRQMCMFLARKNTRYSLEEIGGYFGGRDHTTVMHAVRTIEERRDADTVFANVVRTLEDKLRAPGEGRA